MQTENKSKKSYIIRNSNIELLRIIAMFLIVFHHFCIHSSYTFPPEPSINVIIWSLGITLGKIGVSIFVLITGYYMVTQSLTATKVLKLVVIVWFYSISINLFNIIVMNEPVTIVSVGKALLPIITNQYWFITAYIILIILSPFINSYLNKISTKEHFILCILLILFTIGFRYIGLASIFNYSSFIMLYCVAAFLRLHPQNWFNNMKSNLALFCYSLMLLITTCTLIVHLTYNGGIALGIVPYALSIITVGLLIIICIKRKSQNFSRNILLIALVAITLLSILELGNGKYDSIIKSMNTIECSLIFLVALSTFILFINLRPRHNTIINWIAASSIAVYLIHDSRIIRPLLWNQWIHGSAFFNSNFFIIYGLGITALVFLSCIIIDKIRDYIIFYPLNPLLKRFYSYTEHSFEKILKKIEESLG